MNVVDQLAPAKIDQESHSASRQLVAAVIDDQSACRATFKRVLLSLETEVDIETFSRPIEALEWCQENHPALVITDFRMPEMDGVELVQRLRAIPSTLHTPIIVSTITSDKALKVRALAAGATDFIGKPIDHAECRARCENYLALSNYQMDLREQVAMLNVRLNGQETSRPVLHPTAQDNNEMPVTYVGVDYDELFTLTSTVAAIDKLLEPLRTTITDLEGVIRVPLAGQRTRTN